MPKTEETLRVDDVLVTDGRTSELQWRFSELTSYAASVFTLAAGDLITGGTCKAAKGRKLAVTDLRGAKD